MRPRPWPLQVGPLRLVEADDAAVEEMLTFRNDPEVTRWMIHTYADPEAFRTSWRSLRTSDTDFSCVAVIGGSLVGIGFLEMADGLGQPGVPRLSEASIGYIVRPDRAGEGIATRIAQGLLAAAFEQLGVRRVTAGCYADNLASTRVLEKVGMRREQHGIGDSWHAELGWIDGYSYAALVTDRESWAVPPPA